MHTRSVALGICGVLLALQLAAIWSVAYVPTQDGPVHLEIASALRNLWRHPEGPLAAYYELNPRPEPNFLSDLLLAGLMSVAGCHLAEKVLLGLLLVLLPAGFLYCLRAVRRDAVHLSVLVIPLGTSYFFHMGFHNFNLGVALSLLALGYWLRHADSPTWRSQTVFGAWLLVTAAAHAVPAAFVMLAVGVLSLRDLRNDLRAPEPAPWGEALRRRVVGSVLAGLPAAVLLAVFVSGQPRQAPVWLAPAALLRRFVLLQPMISFDRREHLVVALYGLLLSVLVALALLRRRRGRAGGRADGLLWVAVALTVCYFVAPAGVSGGGYLNPRLELLALLALLLWLAARESTPRERRAVLAVGVAVSLGLLALHLSAYRRLSSAIEEYVSVLPLLPEEGAVLPVSFLDEPAVYATDRSLVSYKIRPFEHAVGYVACDRPLVDLANYQADQGYFAIVYRPSRNPYQHLVSHGAASGGAVMRLDLAEFGRHGGAVDAVLVWGRRASAGSGEGDPLMAQVEVDYERVFTSRPRGLVELYLRRPPPPGAGSS